MRVIKHWFNGLYDLSKLIAGFAIYLRSKQTPAFAYQSMIALFCLTKGYSNDLLSQLIGLVKRPYHFKNASGALGPMGDNAHRGKIVTTLQARGYYIFEQRLSEKVCDRLLLYATSHECKLRPMDGDQTENPIEALYHRGKPRSVRYDFSTEDLLMDKDIQELLADMSFAALAQDYLGSRPVLDVLGMWWHTDFSDKPDMSAAQYFHFDMDRPKWLKIFIYLTDVGPANGPHTFGAGSHKTNGIPSALLQKGYARLTDKEVRAVYEEKDNVEFCAPRGTIIAEDTRGLHKGKHVENADRLILQLQYSNSLFGGVYPTVSFGEGMCDALRTCLEQYPDLYTAYINKG